MVHAQRPMPHTPRDSESPSPSLGPRMRTDTPRALQNAHPSPAMPEAAGEEQREGVEGEGPGTSAVLIQSEGER